MHVQALMMAAGPLSGDITTGLVSWWKLDEGTGSTAADSGSGGLTGNLVNSPSWVTGMIGPFALSFNGTTQYVRMTSTPSSYNFLNSTFTVSCWFKTVTAAAGILISKGANGGVSGTSNGWSLRVNDGVAGTVRGALKDNQGGGGLANSRYSSSTSVCDGNWHQVVAVCTTNTSTQASNTVDIYVDGVLNNGSAINNGFPYAGSTDDIALAARAVPSTPNSFFAGSVDDVRIYNRGLTALDVTTLYAYR